MVPKTGSSTLHALAGCPNYMQNADGSRLPMKERHVWMHSQPYRPCSLATLRDPCERISSIFRHLKERYPQRSTTQHYCKYLTLNGTPGTPACTTHWLHNATNISTFVELLAEHWSEILHHKLQDESSSKRHMVIAMPQHLWIGQYSRIVCTPQLTSDMPLLARELGGCAKEEAAEGRGGSMSCACVANVTAQAAKGTAGERNIGPQGQLQAHDWRGRHYDYAPWPPEQLALSTEGCAQTRALYKRDTQLWAKLCLPSAAVGA